MSYSDGLNKPSQSDWASTFDATEPAAAIEALPTGKYETRIVEGELTFTRKGDDVYTIVFEIISGNFAGRQFTKWFSFSEKAIKYSKRDLALFGLKSAADIHKPFPPPGQRVLATLAIVKRTEPDGTSQNDIRAYLNVRFEANPLGKDIIA